MATKTPSRPAATGRRPRPKERRRSRARARAAFLFLGANRTGGHMYGFRMAQLPTPEYTLLQRLRNDVLGGCTQRVAIATALRVTAEVVREGGVRRVVEHYNEFRSVAPSERRDDLLPEEEILAALAAPSQSPEPPPAVAEEPTEIVILRRECSVNGERFAPGRHVVPASKAAALRAIDVGRG